MIRRETDARLINLISNSEGVRGAICYRDGPMDWTPALAADDIVILSNGQDAVAVFAQTEPRRWQSHTMFSTTCRGKRAVETGRAMVEHMRPMADVLWGATPVKNCAARWFNRQLGAMPIRRDQYEAEGEVEIFEIRM
jgi:hypothetical protein